MRKFTKGFTLIELLIVVALIAMLSAITIVAINPAKNFADGRNSQRSSDVAQILNAVTQYTSEEGHSVADFGSIPTCPSSTSIGTGAGNINISTILVESYLPAVPKDPSVGSNANTGYTICKSSTGRVTVSAPSAERGVTISSKG